MKKIITVLAFLIALSSTSLAQNKFGYMNSLELISLMPETQVADSSLQKYAFELQTLMEKMYKEYDTKANDAATKKQKGLLTPEQEEVVLIELQDLEKRINDFQSSAEEKVETKRQKAYDPILKKANDAIKTVAKANGYTYIFDTSAQALLYAVEGDDIIELVKKQLNIQAPKTTAPKTTTAPK
ncbi:MAG: OmpH family outer membrane protein [Sphingobacteriales bacterium]|jgi:outer membrane protein|nr:MAG: OmpH family outer membrane protein [Sphingobacteriales bacterium]